jgi:hypothetical protein
MQFDLPFVIPSRSRRQGASHARSDHPVARVGSDTTLQAASPPVAQARTCAAQASRQPVTRLGAQRHHIAAGDR